MRGSTPVRYPSNPLLAASSVSMADSFGTTSPALAPPTAQLPPPPAGPPPPAATASGSANRFSLSASQSGRSRYVAPPSALGGIAATPAAPLVSSPMGPPMMTSTPASNVALYNSGLNGSLGPPPAQTPSAMLGERNEYGVNSPLSSSKTPAPVLSVSSTLVDPKVDGDPLNISSGFQEVTEDKVAKAPTIAPPSSSATTPLIFHWFYKTRISSVNLNPFAQTVEGSAKESNANDDKTSERWQPFSMIDSEALETAFLRNQDDNGGFENNLISTDGGRYDANLAKREKTSVYWEEEPMPIRRCSWFHRSNSDGRWSPYEETVASRLESLYQTSWSTDKWDKRLQLDSGDLIMLHSASVMVHVPSGCSSSVMAHLDDWGQVQPQDAEARPRLVHRGLDGLPEIEEGEESQIDHLVFVVHGIGAACDMKFRPINEVVNSFRDLNGDLSNRHFQSAHLASIIGRVEFLPVNWHENLHGEAAGTDNRLKPLTLKSVPKMRSFVNDTLLDILFYTSPKFCQQIVDTVVNEINRMYSVFISRNPEFKGQVTLVGHSLGSLILFDILSHQKAELINEQEPRIELKMANLNYGDNEQNNGNGDHSDNVPKPSIESVFSALEISEYASIFVSENIDLEALKTFTFQELVEAGLSPESATKLLSYLKEDITKSNSSNIDANLVTSEVKYSLGPAGTGQPSVQYSQLNFKPFAFFSLGSPIAMFLSVRGIEKLSTDYKLPTCDRFFNIFHPFDPVAYRVEGLVDPQYSQLRPLTIPHHKGRKRMHLELRDTVTKLMTTDIRQKIVDTLSSVYNLALGNSNKEDEKRDEEHKVQAQLEEEARKNDRLDACNPNSIDARLNNGQRIDYVLQEAPFESFNEYLFALASHLCYWESEDTALMLLREIYASMSVYTDEVKANLRSNMAIPSQTTKPSLISGEQTSGQQQQQQGQQSTLEPPSTGVVTSFAPPVSLMPLTQVPNSATPRPPLNPRPPMGVMGSSLGPTTSSMSSFGMDPTAPVRRDGNIGPPPIGGFYTNKSKN